MFLIDVFKIFWKSETTKKPIWLGPIKTNICGTKLKTKLTYKSKFDKNAI